MTVEEVEQRLKAAYPDCELAVIDMTGGGSNFDVRIASNSFEGKSRVKQHQEVMAVFSKELESGEIHALAIKTLKI